MTDPEQDRYDALDSRCARLEEAHHAALDRLSRIEAAAAAQIDATSRAFAADTQQTAGIAEVRATTEILSRMLTGPPSFDTRFAELHALANRPAPATMSAPGFNVNLPDPDTLGKYGDALRKWGLRAVAVAFALVGVLKINACDTNKLIDRIDSRFARDSTARSDELRGVQADAEADRSRNTGRILEAVGDSAATAPTDR